MNTALRVAGLGRGHSWLRVHGLPAL